MKRFWIFLLLLPLTVGCHKNNPEEDQDPIDGETQSMRYYVNMFGYNVMKTYYLWNEEISEALKTWATNEDPIEKVKAIRYKNAAGEDIDRWTMMTDDYESFISSVAGEYKTAGLDFQLYYADASKKRIVGVVTYTFAGSPAEKAGLLRGDVFTKVNGQEMTVDNYSSLLSEAIYGGGTFQLTLKNGKTVSLTPVVMAEEAVNVVRVLESGGKKVGYMHYTDFTRLSLAGLMPAFQDFKAEGIDDLVLDLRYNGGGYVDVCTVLGSLIAPLDKVNEGAVFTTEVMNAILTEAWEEEPTCFQADFGEVEVSKGVKVRCAAAEANPGVQHLYVLTTSNTASASESLVCGLRPYMDVTVIGQQTHGKYCAGLMISSNQWYDAVKKELEEGVYDKAQPYIENWGIYVMYARYADCNGETISMPDGIAPDVLLDDDPMDGYALGDPRETMLAAALARIGGQSAASSPSARTRAIEPSLALPTPDALRRPGFGVLVGDPHRRFE